MIVEFPCNTYLFSYTDEKTDRLIGGKTDRQVNKLKYFFFIFWRRGGGGGYWVDGGKNSFRLTKR